MFSRSIRANELIMQDVSDYSAEDHKMNSGFSMTILLKKFSVVKNKND